MKRALLTLIIVLAALSATVSANAATPGSTTWPAPVFGITPNFNADDSTPPIPVPPCSDTQGPPCSIVILPQGPCDNTVPGNVCPQGPPANIIAKLDGRIDVGSQLKTTHVDPLYSKVAQAISGVSNAQIRCFSKDDWSYLGPYFYDAYGVTLSMLWSNPYTGDGTYLPDDKALINPSICAQLDLMAYQHKWPHNLNLMVQMANALDTLAHEPQHIGHQKDELTAQCWALQDIEKVGIMLGLPKAYAHQLGQLAWSYIQTSAPMVYQDPLACKAGKLLDKNNGFLKGK